MSFINDLQNASNSVENLTLFIQKNFIEIYDFFISQKSKSIFVYRLEIESFILSKYSLYQKLDFTDSKNQTFLFCLLDISQRFGLATEFQQVYNLCIQNHITLNSRLDASAKFLIGINTIKDYEDRTKEILSDLAVSFLKEEDNEQITIATLIYFYTEVFYNFGNQNIDKVIAFRTNLLKQLQKEEYKFLLTQSVEEILSYSLQNLEELYQAVFSKLDEILERASQYLAFNIEPHLIESDTHYVELLKEITSNFQEIRNLSKNLYKVVDSNEIFRSLQRGVKVLTEKNQLLAYLISYGNMHQAKMKSAITSIEKNDLQNELEIYDWGCGQGLASICLLEYFDENNFKYSIKKSTLIEPSEIAIKRASLHLRKFTSDTKIITINKDLDSLVYSDFESKATTTKIHLFSNILDVDMFSMTGLLKLLKNNFAGNNIFICASPFVSNYKTERIDSFVHYFSKNLNFELLNNISEKKGEWAGKNWSRVIRVFKCTI